MYFVIAGGGEVGFHLAKALLESGHEIMFKALGIDETISSTRVLMSVIEQELPSSGFLPLMPLTGSHLELIEAEIGPSGPSAGKTVQALGLPRGTAVGGVVRKGSVLHADEDLRLEVGDRLVILAPTKDEAEVRKAL